MCLCFGMLTTSYRITEVSNTRFISLMLKKTDEGKFRFADTFPALSTSECRRTLDLVILLHQVVAGTSLLRREKIQCCTTDREFPFKQEELFVSESPGSLKRLFLDPQAWVNASLSRNQTRNLIWGDWANLCSGVLPHLSFSSHLISMCVLHLNTCRSERRFWQPTRLLKRFVTQTLSLRNLLQRNEQNWSWTSVTGSVESSLFPALIASLLCQFCCINKPTLPRSSSSSSSLLPVSWNPAAYLLHAT